jgi:hypothetical protein
LQELELYDIDESQYIALLNEIPNLWEKNTSFYQSSLKPVFKSFNDFETLVFGVHIFKYGSSSTILVVLSEYIRDAKLAVFNFTATTITGVFSPTDYKSGEIKFAKMLEEITYEDLERITQQHDTNEVFVCPVCKAQYAKRVLRVTPDGKVECQNCLALVDPNEIHDDTSHYS